jgi:hypothetical protein
MVIRGSNADPVFQRELGRDYSTIDRGEGIHLYDMAGSATSMAPAAYSSPISGTAISTSSRRWWRRPVG